MLSLQRSGEEARATIIRPTRALRPDRAAALTRGAAVVAWAGRGVWARELRVLCARGEPCRGAPLRHVHCSRALRTPARLCAALVVVSGWRGLGWAEVLRVFFLWTVLLYVVRSRDACLGQHDSTHARASAHAAASRRACLDISHTLGTSPVHARPVEAPTSRFDSRGCPVPRWSNP